MNPLSSELPFCVHNWLIISLKDFCLVIRKWPTFLPSMISSTFLSLLICVSFELISFLIALNALLLHCLQTTIRDDESLPLSSKIVNSLLLICKHAQHIK